MAVFTAVSLEDLRPWMGQFNLGLALNIRGISSGIENSNFFLTTEKGEYVLTLFECLSFQELPYYLHLMRHLAQKGIAVPAPIPNQAGEILHALNGKPATIVTKLQGESQLSPQAPHCAEVGAMLARMHVAAQDFEMTQANLRSYAWWQTHVPTILNYLSDSNRELMQTEMAYQIPFKESETYRALYQGPVHADLFRNNVMFVQDKLSGFFDFYFAGNDTWLFDVAVTANDWCIDLETGQWDTMRLQAFLYAYHQVRPFTDVEHAAWQTLLRAAAFRFWLSRLMDWHLPREAALLKPHDPTHFERILRLRRESMKAEHHLPTR